MTRCENERCIREARHHGPCYVGQQPAPARPAYSGPAPGSWRAVATVLANRMHHHAFCEEHPDTRPDDDCPFCNDRAAYQLFEEKLRRANQ